MPNWVFNTLSNYTPDLHEKYRSENTDIDFDKIIPEPEEIKHTISGSYNDIAKDMVAYRDYIKDGYRYKIRSIKYDKNNPLRDRVDNMAIDTSVRLGELVIENPDESLNTLFDNPKNEYLKHKYDDYVKVFGNKGYSSIDDRAEVAKIFENYCQLQNESYQNYKSKSEDDAPFLPDTIEEYGEYLNKCTEKYGFDNWYDWRCANWGVKWNACETEYDKEGESLHFDTPWSIPYPIIAKIAKDNPQANIDGYSEEEQGWFDEYRTDNGNVHITCRGELSYCDENGNELEEPNEEREEVNEVLSYDEFSKQSVEDWKTFISGVKNKF